MSQNYKIPRCQGFITYFITLMLISGMSYGQQSDSTSNSNQSRKFRKHSKTNVNLINTTPDLSDPAFIDYEDALIYLTPEEYLQEPAYLRVNFTDQFISVWQNPGRIYPASRIFGFSQNGDYYRACKFDSRNAVFGRLIVKGEMSLYYCRKLPQEAGLTEFISTDPNNKEYRNFMINQYKDRARFANDYYYFIVLNDDSLTTVPIKDFNEFATNYLFDSPEAYAQMVRYSKKKTILQKIIAPVIVGVVGVAAIASGSLKTGILISSPFIAGGFVYYFVNKKKPGQRPEPEKMAEIIRLYNNTSP